jgi:hypothetical protein
VKNGIFTPLVLGTNGTMGDECKKIDKELTCTINRIRTRFNFNIIGSALLLPQRASIKRASKAAD